MNRTRELLREPWVQRGVRASLAAALAWQVAVLLPPAIAQYAYYAPLGAVIAVHPTVADSAAAAWRTVLAILLGFGLAVAVQELSIPIPGALTIALIVALAIGVEQWRLLQEHASWVSFAAVLMLTAGSEDPARYAVAYAGLTLLGAAIGVLVTTVLFPPLQLTSAARSVDTTRALLARHLRDIASGLRRGEVPTPASGKGAHRSWRVRWTGCARPRARSSAHDGPIPAPVAGEARRQASGSSRAPWTGSPSSSTT